MPGTVGRIPALPSAVAGAMPTADPTVAPPAGLRWLDTPLGAPEHWDPAVRAVVDLVLSAPVAMALAYGDELALIYNDGFAELIAAKHPGAFGRPAAEVFHEVWHVPGVGDVLERVYRTGEAFLAKEAPLPIVREEPGLSEQSVFTRGYSAIRDSVGQTIGVLTVTAETTQVTQRLQNLSELASALSGTLTLDDVARVALRSAVSTFGADQAEFGVDDGAGWRVVRRLRGEVLDEADERLPPLWRRHDAGSSAPLVRTADSGTPMFASDGQPLLHNAVDRHDEKIRALAAFPLRTPSLRGGLAVAYRQPHRWPPPERALLTASAELVAQAAERARRFETQHGTAQLLQRSMLPEHLPDLPLLRIAARYDAGVDGNAAGGDFYDAFALPDGRLAVVLGDVAGHDVQAAALMGQVRAALRALALSDPDPTQVLAGLDRLVTSLSAEAHSDELFVTVVYGLIEPGGERLTIASAGHPPPLIRRGSPGQPAAVRYVDVPPGVPLGLDGPRATVTVDFPPGDTLLLFSDGVVERRQRSLSEGFDLLATAVAGAATGDPRTLCALATGAVPGSTEDDVAVLAVEHATTPSRSASMEVPAEPTAPGRVRHWMSAQLTLWAVPEQVVSGAVLCTSELTTNALLHAGTAARVEIDLSPERLLVSVADSGTRGAVTRTRTEKLSSRGRGLGLIEQLSDAWGTDPTVRGSTVWFEMLIPSGSTESD
ncbi:SpoIIE family protein phosphatase [Plantactinospora sp. S1510]|uniref:SpoIIE family protein phosphatase n=1 Tax=Plantactinospora alkalitolerans TaxID=2789879 RepID=A0ABS0GS69_9ACTN|nr:SpoIIE family protein phosphatase [Plantactinospora alkalitolerans]MBF9129037.1 SpoIIE family protein phosphatase [Plantactinospora alkalitolerans]